MSGQRRRRWSSIKTLVDSLISAEESVRGEVRYALLKALLTPVNYVNYLEALFTFANNWA